MVGDPEWLNSYVEGVSDILNSLLPGLACYHAPPPKRTRTLLRKGVLSMVAGTWLKLVMNKSVTYLETSMF